MEDDVFYYAQLSDEELANLNYVEHPLAENELCKRYLNPAVRRYCAFVANQVLATTLDELTIYDSYINALSIASRKYNPRIKCTFRTFLVSIFRNEMLKSAKQYFLQSSIVSLDEQFVDSEGEAFCLCDILPSQVNANNSPIFYVESKFVESVISKMSRYNRRVTRRLIDNIQIGYSLLEACKRSNISYAKGRYIVERLIDALKDSSEVNLKYRLGL